MARVRVYPGRVSGRVVAPPSKSYTHRAVILASLSQGESWIQHPLTSRDTWASLEACKALGADIRLEGEAWRVKGVSQPRCPEDVIDVENSGTTMRFMTAVSALIPQGFTVLTGDASIRRRPMKPLLTSLRDLGVECWSSRGNGCPPIIVRGGGVKGGKTLIRGDISSQFISALLVMAPKAQGETLIEVVGEPVSKPYIEATLHMLRYFGASLEVQANRYIVPGGQEYEARRFQVMGDFSSAALILALAALTGSTVTVEGLDFQAPQADAKILEILGEMGVKPLVEKGKGTVTLAGGDLKGGCFSLSESPDLLPVVAVLALKARGKTIITGVSHARYKESDRIANLARELSKFGVWVQERRDGLILEGVERLKGCSLDAHGDHRLFMALCVAAAGAEEPCVVEGAETVDVSYPGFIEDVKGLGLEVEVLEDAG